MRKYLCATASGLIAALGLSGAALACSPDYTGVTLKVGSQTGPFIASAMQAAGESWEKQTCGKVEVVEFPFGELYPKYLTAMVAGEASFDVITFAPAWTPDFAPYLSEMPEKIRTTEEWEDIAPVYRDRLMVWNGKHLSQTIDGDLHTLSYRLDLFNDPRSRRPSRRSTATTWPRRRPGTSTTTSPSSSPGRRTSSGARPRLSAAAASSSGSSSPTRPATPTTRTIRAACSSIRRPWTPRSTTRVG